MKKIAFSKHFGGEKMNAKVTGRQVQISKILYQADPEKLRPCGCPKDEYDSEAKIIVEQMMKVTGSALSDLFRDRFAGHNLLHPKKFWADLAKKINQVL